MVQGMGKVGNNHDDGRLRRQKCGRGKGSFKRRSNMGFKGGKRNEEGTIGRRVKK